MKNKNVVVVGGGVIGTMHALRACEAGFSVTQLERDFKPQAASVRNFGLIWVSGRAAGMELDLAIRARELWAQIGSKAEVGFRGNGSLTIAQSAIEHRVLEEALNLADANKRGFTLLSREQTRQAEPLLAGEFYGALRCDLDASIEPAILLGGLQKYLNTFENYQWIPDCEVVDFAHDQNGNHVTNRQGKKFSAEFLVICPGAQHNGFISQFMQDALLRKVRLQMAATVPIFDKLSHSVADVDSLRYYPAFKELSLSSLEAQSEIAARFKMQLLLVQRLDGSMTIGDTHEYEQPFSHELEEAPYEHLAAVISKIFGLNSLKIERRWDGIYSQSTSSDIYFRKTIAPGAMIVTGGGGRGNTLAPAIAEESIKLWEQSN